MSQPETAPVYDARRVGQLLGIEYSAKELAAFGPPPRPVEGWVTFFDPGLSLLTLQSLETIASRPEPILDPWNHFEDESDVFGQHEAPAYRQLRMTPYEASFGMSEPEMFQLLGSDEIVPSARVVVMGVVIHFLASGVRLLPDSFCICSDTENDLGGRIVVGFFTSPDKEVGIEDAGLGVLEIFGGDIAEDGYIALLPEKKL